MTNDIYCIDSSSLIELYHHYPDTVFEGLWKNIDILISQNRLFSCREVFSELQDEWLVKWAKSRREIFRDLTDVGCNKSLSGLVDQA